MGGLNLGKKIPRGSLHELCSHDARKLLSSDYVRRWLNQYDGSTTKGDGPKLAREGMRFGMEVIPAIDVLGGQCVRLYQGDYGQVQTFDENPVAVARRWEEAGATRLHVVDLDGAKAGHPVNLAAIEAIACAVTMPVQVGGGLRDRQSAASLLNLGVQRVILGTVAVEQPELVSQLCQEFPGQIVVGIDARNGRVATRGWLETSEVLATELAQQMANAGAAAIIYTDIHRDGTMQGPNLEALRELVTAIAIPVIASGGVSSVRDLLSLLALEPLGVTGAIVGKALYTGEVSLQEAIRAVGSGRWQDVPPDFGSSALA
jgi:phosphoribosylformimino-5-aminoimidazole carboxamide ribotide isomerase